MTPLQAIVAIVVAVIGVAGGAFGFAQFMIKRKDDKEQNTIQKQIDNAIALSRKEMKEFLTQGLIERGEEGRQRFEINSKQIESNTVQIGEILGIVKDQAEKYDLMASSITALNDATAINAKLTKACAEGMRSTTYDRILLVASKALKRKQITISEKTNLRQLYNSYTELQGKDARIETIYEDCLKLEVIPDDE